MMDNLTQKTKQEIRTLSRFIGARYARWITFALQIPVFFPLYPSSQYIMLVTILLPLLLRAVLQKSSTNINQEPALPLIRQKYHYTDAKYRAEKNTTPLLLLFLCIWQIQILSVNLSPVLRIYPGILLIANVIIRLGGTLLFRFYLHHQFTQLHTLDDI